MTGRRKGERGRRKEERGKRKEERGKRKEERGLPNCLTNSYLRMYADNTLLTYNDKDVNIIQSCLNED